VNYRRLGRTGIEVSEIGFGAWGIGGRQWLGGNDHESLRALRLALDRGINFIDTALAYNEGHSERLIGQVVKESPDRVWIATKAPPKNRIWPAQPGVEIEEVFPYRYIVECTETSLRNLGVERIDLQQLHVWNPEWIAREEWRRAAEDLKAAGKIAHFGISINAHQPDSALTVVDTGAIDTVQVIYNIFDQTPEDSLFPKCLQHDVGVLARVPLDEGALTGTIRENTEFAEGDFRASYFRGERKRQVVERVAALQKNLTDVTGSLPEIALRFCLSHQAVSTVIPGMRKVANVEANSSVSAKGPLSKEVLARLKQHAWTKNFYS
jgi:aryl-alcohol dehydrogenase-like predicted oxidoreductase